MKTYLKDDCIEDDMQLQNKVDRDDNLEKEDGMTDEEEARNRQMLLERWRRVSLF